MADNADKPMPARGTARRSGSHDREQQQVTDQHTDAVAGTEVANAAAESLHGSGANEEVRPQPEAVALDSRTLIATDAPGEPDPSRTDRDQR
jgi:hypothetical protein